MKLFYEAIFKFIIGLLLVCILVFLPAGTVYYPGGWLLIILLFGPMLVAGAVMLLTAPEFLKNRLDSKEKRVKQQGIVIYSGLMFIAGFVIAGLDFRFGWSKMPQWMTIAASLLFLIFYILYAEVMKENAYLSRTVKVEEGQTVVDTGLYGVVRHPMYMTTLVLFWMIPFILGSWYSIVPFACYPVILAARIKDEEVLLSKELLGYTQYQQKVKYRLIPFIW